MPEDKQEKELKSLKVQVKDLYKRQVAQERANSTLEDLVLKHTQQHHVRIKTNEAAINKITAFLKSKRKP